MTINLKNIISVVASMFVAANAFAQGNVIKAKLVDDTDQAVAFATVSLIPDGAEKASKYVLSSDEGAVLIAGVRNGKYTVKAELMGYMPSTVAVTIQGKEVDLGKIVMKTDTKLLDAASISAVGNPITVKKDTIEYNASSFKTTDNDMLEDLLKKLPGVEVNSDGSVTANGKTISKITIDGKTFFLDDPSLASKNIPAKIVEKVKVIEKKSDQAMFTGIDDGEEETIIDLRVRKGMMNGWFGNIMGGGGHDIQRVGMGQPARWQGAAMVGRFTDKSQISLILNGNNTNNRGFNDMAGSMMAAMRGGGGGMGRGGSGGGGWWGGDNGITTSWMGGLNGAFTLCDGNMDLGANYLYNGSIKVVEEETDRTTFRDNGHDLHYHSLGDSYTFTNGHRFGVRLEHKFSKKTSILFEPQFNFGNGNYHEYSGDTTMTRNGDVFDPTNRGYTGTYGSNKNWTASGFLLFRQKIGDKPGRTFSVNARYNFSGNNINGYNQSLSEVYDKATELWAGDPTIQHFKAYSNSNMIMGRASYTEPLAEKLFLEITYGYTWSKSISDRRTFDYLGDAFAFDPTNYWTGGRYNSTYSNHIVNIHQNHRAGFTLQYQTKKLRAQIGAQFTPTITENHTNGKDYKSTVYNWSPQVMVNYDISDNTNFRIFYRGRSNQPSTNQLMPVPDNSNPLRLSFGNPYLKPYFNHGIRGRFGHTDKKTFFSVNAWGEGNVIQNSISSASWVDSKGVQYSMPMNAKVTGNFNLGAFLNAPIAKSGFSLSNMLNINFSATTNYVGKASKADELGNTYYDSETANFNYELFNKNFGDVRSENFAEYFETNKTRSLGVTERLKATYRNDFVEIGLSGRTRFSKPWYSMETAVAKMTWSNQVGLEMKWTIPGGVGINADSHYNWYNNYTTAQPASFLLNAEITKLLFKDKFTLAIKGYDLLNQSRNLSVMDTDNYHLETRNNTLGRYIIVSLTYRFGNFGKAGQQMRDRYGDRGPGGPGGPRR